MNPVAKKFIVAFNSTPSTEYNTYEEHVECALNQALEEVLIVLHAFASDTIKTTAHDAGVCCVEWKDMLMGMVMGVSNILPPPTDEAFLT